jgi:uncharacterized membrane protein
MTGAAYERRRNAATEEGNLWRVSASKRGAEWAFSRGNVLRFGEEAMAETLTQRRVTAISIDRRPVFSLLVPIPVICFIGAVLTDLAYQGSDGNFMWADFSSWLIAAGLLFGAIGGAVLLIDSIRGGSWVSFLLLLAAWIAEFINSLVHARDGWTAVVPTGLILSVIGSLLILASGWTWRPIRYWTPGERT